MEDGQRVDQPVGLAEAPDVDKRQRVRRQVLVRQHGALRAPRRPRGIEDRRQIVFFARDRVEVGRRAGDGLRERPVLRDPEALGRPEAVTLVSSRIAASEAGRQIVSAGWASLRKYSSSAIV